MIYKRQLLTYLNYVFCFINNKEEDLNKGVQIIPIFEATPTASFSGLSLI